MINISDIDFIKELFEKYRQPMYKVALGILHNKHDAEDAVQNAFLAIINNLEKISRIPCNEMVFYFVNITEHMAINIYNKQKRHVTEDIDLYENTASEQSVEKEAADNIVIEEIKSSLRELSDRDYSIMYMYLFKQLKPKEIAGRLGIPEQRIHLYIKRARERLIKILKRRGIDYDV